MISGWTSRRAIRATICLIVALSACSPSLGGDLARSIAGTDVRRSEAYTGLGTRTAPEVEELSGKLPLSFEPNLGQADSRARFVARTRNYGVFLTDTEAVLSLPISRPGGQEVSESPESKSVGRAFESEGSGVAVVRMRFDGAGPDLKAVAERELPGKVNYLRGNDPEKWQHEVPTFAGVRIEGLYDGIDAIF